MIRRVVTGIAAAGVVGLATVGAATLPEAEVHTDSGNQVPVAVTPVTMVCPGATRLATADDTEGDVAYDPEFDPTPSDSATTLTMLTVTDFDGPGQAAEGSYSPVGSSQRTPFPTMGTAAQLFADSHREKATVLTATPIADSPASAAGVSMTTTPSGDLRGVAAAPCRPPQTQLWLVGGSTKLGSSERLTLANPGLTAATVRIEAWGITGPVDMDAGASQVIPAGSELTLNLEGIAIEQQRLVFRITASGGKIVANLQDSLLNGLVPYGVSFITAGAAPARTQTITGISVTDSEKNSDESNLVRLLTPGDKKAHASVQVVGKDGVVAAFDLSDIRLEAGVVHDIKLDGLPAGTYSVNVTADQPVVAGALVTRTGTATARQAVDPIDRAWIAAQRPAHKTVMAVPATGSSTLAVAATEDISVEVQMIDETGAVIDSSEVAVAANTTSALSIVELAGTASAAAVVLTSGGEFTSAISVTTAVAQGQGITVYTPTVASTHSGDATVVKGVDLSQD